ncbi:unnamed protein product [Rotaria socialis]|uniref:Uncharacterized protein n=2 Tax=Rotaria socialis TaxID=392032 RepID=A0A818AT12_9BILA|nr:unnamed protein product [Rotaria socialis]CAF3460571.1 unnamed protein product [Rotaria socialis]CAF4396156.1 unnamed protein product [Rotaria socialis]
MLFDYSSVVNAYDFQCLTCDNFIDGPGCGEFTKQIPVRACRTFCYFAIIYNRSLLSSSESKRQVLPMKLIRAIRDCSPYDDMSIEGNILLESKVGSLSSSSLSSTSSPPPSHIDIITIKRCNSEQCNNEFYLESNDFLYSLGSSYRRISFPLLFVLFMIIFYFMSMF